MKVRYTVFIPLILTAFMFLFISFEYVGDEINFVREKFLGALCIHAAKMKGKAVTDLAFFVKVSALR